MKKYLFILLLTAFLMAGFGCNTERQTGDGLVSDIQSALESNQKMKCVYRDDTVETVSYVQGETYRTEYTLDDDTYVSIFDGETMTTWNETTREGNTYAISCLGELGDNDSDDDAPTSDSPQLEDYYASQETGYDTAEDLLEDRPNLECHTVTSIDFSIPDDLDLYDQCEDLKRMLDINLDDYADDFKESASD